MTLGGRKAAKWGLWTLLLFALTGLQSAPAVAAAASPVLGAAMAVSVLLAERNEAAACGFAAFAGLLWDVSAGKLLGYYGLMLLGAGAAACWLLRNCSLPPRNMESNRESISFFMEPIPFPRLCPRAAPPW